MSHLYILMILIGVLLLIGGLFISFGSMAVFAFRALGNAGSGSAPDYTIFGYPPEVITCIAGLITALAGLIAAFAGLILAIKS